MESPKDLFELHEIATGTRKGQAVLTGFFLGGETAEIVVLHLDENGDRHLRMYGFVGGAWTPVLDARLGSDVVFVDVAEIAGRDRLITYDKKRLSWFDPASATEHPLVEMASDFNTTPSGRSYAGSESMARSHSSDIPHLDISRDLNGDGRDDLVMPDVDGFWISTQSTDGSFTDAVKLGPPEPFLDDSALNDPRAYGEIGVSELTIPWYLSRVHQLDYDRDGRSDLVFWNEDHFDVHLQNERGGFDAVPQTFTADVPFDSDGAYSFVFGFPDKSPAAMILGFGKKNRQTVLQALRDVNGDGVADLVTHTQEGRSGLRQRSRFEVYYGTPTAGGIAFAGDIDTAIEPRRRRPAALEHAGYSSQRLTDLDGDGQVDIVLGDVRMGLTKILRAIVGKSVAVDLEFYRNQAGSYPERPTARLEIRPELAMFELRPPFFPRLLLGDVNGDGLSDLLVGERPGQLRVFPGVPGPELLARRPREVSVTWPKDERHAWLVDLNRDGKQDILMHHPSATESHRLTTLIAR